MVSDSVWPALSHPSLAVWSSTYLIFLLLPPFLHFLYALPTWPSPTSFLRDPGPTKQLLFKALTFAVSSGLMAASFPSSDPRNHTPSPHSIDHGKSHHGSVFLVPSWRNTGKPWTWDRTWDQLELHSSCFLGFEGNGLESAPYCWPAWHKSIEDLTLASVKHDWFPNALHHHPDVELSVLFFTLPSVTQLQGPKEFYLPSKAIHISKITLNTTLTSIAGFS